MAETSKGFERARKEAKRWLKALRSGDGGALERFQKALPRHTDNPGLREVQQALARERGFESWAALKEQLAFELGTDGKTLVDQFLSLACLSFSGDDWPKGPSSDPRRGKWTAAERLRSRHPEVSTATFACAVVCGEIVHVEHLLKAEPALAARPGGTQGWEPLLLLCHSRLPHPPAVENSLAMAELLLDHGADPNAHWFWPGGTKYKFTALTGVLGQGEMGAPEHARAEELARLLLERGADPNDEQALYNTHLVDDDTRWLEFLGRYGFSSRPEHHKNLSYLAAQAAENGRVKRLRWLLDHGADPNAHSIYSGKTCHQLALINGRPAVAELLEEFGAQRTTLDGRDAFLAAVARGDEADARRLLEGHHEYLEKVDPLIDAAEQNRLALVRRLLELGMDPKKEGQYGKRALNVACASRELTDLLLEYGADPAARCFGGTVAYWAYLGGHFEMARYHAEKSRSIFDAVVSGHLELARELLVEDPERVRKKDSHGDTPLHRLPDELERAEPMLELLLAHGADPQAKNEHGKTPPEVLEERGRDDLCDLLEAASDLQK